MNEIEHSTDYVELTVDIVSAYVSNNPVPPGELAQLITRTHAALIQVASGQVEAKAAARRLSSRRSPSRSRSRPTTSSASRTAGSSSR